MYYPILRGRQNELLAIQELLKKEKLSNCLEYSMKRPRVKEISSLPIQITILCKESSL